MANKAQRKVNRWVRRQNKELAKDEFLGLNRFKMSQVNRYHRGYETIYEFLILDLKTDEMETLWVDNYNFQRKLFWGMNDFIIAIRMKEGW